MLGIGIIGAGRISSAHAAAAAALQNCSVTAIADPDAARAHSLAAAYQATAFTRYQDLIDDDDVDAVVICLPHHLHCPVTIECLGAGKHVLLEKPMALNVGECDEMLAAARAAGARLMVGHSQQFFPVNRAVAAAIRRGDIGDLVLATDTWYKPFFEGVRPDWFLSDATGGGMWPMNGSHMIDRMLFLLQREVVAVRGTVRNTIHGLSSDSGIAYLQFDDGCAAVVAHAGYREGVNRFEAEITGTEGQIRICGDAGGGAHYWRSRAGQWEEEPASPPELSLRPGAAPGSPVFTAQMAEFAGAIEGRRESSISGEYGRRVVRIMNACVESGRSGREILLD